MSWLYYRLTVAVIFLAAVWSGVALLKGGESSKGSGPAAARAGDPVKRKNLILISFDALSAKSREQYKDQDLYKKYADFVLRNHLE